MDSGLVLQGRWADQDIYNHDPSTADYGTMWACA